jgi:hypothetical protein|tara:strand:- start:656 stop:979 length:324 start_codon:yes stop_codon:yes gene_type:complete
MEEEFTVRLEPEEARVNPIGVIRVIWSEMSGGVGSWGVFRPIFSILISLIPFLYLGQHFNGQHKKAFGWSLIQLPLILSIVLWPVLFIWSILDSWWISNEIIASKVS